MLPIDPILPVLPPTFDRHWQLHLPEPLADPVASIATDDRLLQQVIAGTSGPLVSIQRHPRCLVVTRREARMPNFSLASQALADAGCPVVVRGTGGSCVPQGEGVMNLSVVHPGLKNRSLEDGYHLLVELLSRLLRSYGLDPATGLVPGAFCDGRFNLQLGGRKLVGTAQRWSGSSRTQSAVLAHACLLVDLDLVEAAEQANLLYRLCGSRQRFDPLACTTLREALLGTSSLAGEALRKGVEQRMVEVLAEVFGLSGVIA